MPPCPVQWRCLPRSWGVGVFLKLLIQRKTKSSTPKKHVNTLILPTSSCKPRWTHQVRQMQAVAYYCFVALSMATLPAVLEACSDYWCKLSMFGVYAHG